MASMSFKNQDFLAVSDALDIAEDATGNSYKFSMRQWKRHNYEVKTLLSLNENEISKNAFAVLSKGSRVISGFEPKTKGRDFYFICLQDHLILNALKRDKELRLLPLLVYIFTHELVHIVRFCNFFQRFDVSGKGKDREETVVHARTYEILQGFSLPKLDYVLDVYKGHRVCDMVAS